MAAKYLNIPSLLTQFYPTYINVTKVLLFIKQLL